MTIFRTPIIRHICIAISYIFLKLTGWKFKGGLPKEKGFILICAPHTSNWDFIIMMMMSFCLGLDSRWLGKASLFKGIWGPMFKWMGGQPVIRSHSTNLVDAVANSLKENPELKILIAPEGTRKKVDQWKSGFYHMAYKGEVPIAFAYIIYAQKIAGIEEQVFYPTGNYEEDMVKIRAFYDPIDPRLNG